MVSFTNDLHVSFFFSTGGCGGGGSQESEQEPSQSSDSGSEPAPLKAALLTSGPVNDGGWNTQAYEGLLMLKDELGYEIAFTENAAS